MGSGGIKVGGVV